MVRFRSAQNAPQGKRLKLVAILSAEMSKAFPVSRVMFSSLGVWSMLSSPKNQREPSAESSLKTLTVPLGRVMPSLLVLELDIYILLLALTFLCEKPPELTLMKLYFLTLMPQTLGMNSTCFWELSSRVTVQLRVYMWKSEKDFSEKERGAAAAIVSPRIRLIPGALQLSLTMLISPAISLSLASWYLFPLLLSMVTHPPISAFFYSASKISEQSDFQLKPVVLQMTSQSVVTAFQLETFNLRVGTVLKPAGREGKVTPSTFLYISIPLLVFRMKPLLRPRKMPLILSEFCPNLTTTSISLLMNFLRMALVSTQLTSYFCSNTSMLSGSSTALKITVSVWILEETSVKQRSLRPSSKEISLTSFTMAKRLLQTVTARDLAPLISEAWRRVSKRANRRILIIIIMESGDIDWLLNSMKSSNQQKGISDLGVIFFQGMGMQRRAGIRSL